MAVIILGDNVEMSIMIRVMMGQSTLLCCGRVWSGAKYVIAEQGSGLIGITT